MKWWLPLFGLICFTSPDGYHLWIVKEQIVAFGHTVAGAPPQSYTEIWTATESGTFYVKETPDEVAKALQ